MSEQKNKLILLTTQIINNDFALDICLIACFLFFYHLTKEIRVATSLLISHSRQNSLLERRVNFFEFGIKMENNDLFRLCKLEKVYI